MDFSKLSNRQQRFAEDHLYGYTDSRYQCVRAWFTDMEKVAKMIHLVDDSILLNQAIRNLSDESKRWYIQNQSRLSAWSDFKREMILHFGKGTDVDNMNDFSQSKTLMKERRRNIVWHPQHIAYYRLYRSTMSYTDHTTNFSLPSTLLFEVEPSEDSWPSGTESWNIHEIKHQRELFARERCIAMKIPPSDGNRFTSENTAQQLKFDTTRPGYHINEAPPQRLSFLHPSYSEKLTNVRNITHFIEHQQSHDSIELEIGINRHNRIMENQNYLFTISSSRFLTNQLHYGSQHLLFFLNNVCLPLLFSLWFFDTPQTDFGHYSLYKLLESKHYLHVSTWLLVVRTFFVHLNPFIKTIATLRTLESLLLYATTC